AAHFALRTPGGDAGFLADVEELRAGMLWRLDAVGVRARRFARPAAPATWLRLADDDAYASAWREALCAAVDAALAGARAPGLSLSGGIDSGALAACAGERVSAWSWSLPAHPECDEGPLAATACAATGARPHVFAGDAHAPLTARDAPVHPDAPSANAFRALREAQLGYAREAGCDVLLSGNYGDHAYPEGDAWLFALLRSRRATRLGDELRGRWRRAGARALWQDAGWRAPLRRLLRRTASASPPWLDERARALLESAPREHDVAANSTLNRRLHRTLLGRAAALDASLDTFWSDRHGIELRYPYRDPRVIAFVLALPADVQWRHGEQKALTRRMLAGRLPEALRLRPKSGSLLPFFRAAIRGTQRARAEALLFAPDARWPAYVRRDAMERAWAAPDPRESDDLLLWQAVSHERWWRALERETPMLGSTA
ncbi:MAG TPA: asparagine synthase-related protein, partial [Xanthomonadales bacterium]|nr:asparagine synthase-related protein [Xanthomonadales bacterium]